MVSERSATTDRLCSTMRTVRPADILRISATTRPTSSRPIPWVGSSRSISSGSCAQVDPVDRDEPLELLRQPSRLEDHLVGHTRPCRSGPGTSHSMSPVSGQILSLDLIGFKGRRGGFRSSVAVPTRLAYTQFVEFI